MTRPRHLLVAASLACLASLVSHTHAQSTTVTTVPWYGNPNHEHEVYDGGTIVLQGVATVAAGCTLTSATWDPGDGSGPVDVPHINPRVLELNHTYSGLPGQPFVAMLTVTDSCGHSATDTMRVRVHADTLGTRVNMAVDRGLWHLHKTMALASSGGVPTGMWLRVNRASATASAVQALMAHGHFETGDRTEDPYVDDVARGLAHLMTELMPFALSIQPAGDPDVNGNGIGLRIPISTSSETRLVGLAVDALVTTGTPERIAQTGGSGVLGESYCRIVEDLMETYYWGQADSGLGRGGWRYSWNQDADNSVCFFAALGAVAAARGFGVSPPQFVKDENRLWLGVSQAPSGHYGYNTATSCADIRCVNTTPAGLVQLIMDDQDRSNPDWLAAENYLLTNFSALTSFNRIWGMYATAQAMRLAAPRQVHLLGGTFDWLSDPFNGLGPFLVNTQQADGSWDGSRWVQETEATAFALVTLSSTIFARPPMAACDVAPPVTAPGVAVRFSGSRSFATAPGASIVAWEWDFDGDGVPDASGPEVQHAFPVPGTHLVKLRVRDNQEPPSESTRDCAIQVVPPPVPPHADTGGPYTLWLGLSPPHALVAHGAATDRQLTWEWDLAPQPLDLDFDDASGPAVDLTSYYAHLGPGLWDLAVRVTDPAGGTSVGFTTVRVRLPRASGEPSEAR